MRSFLTLCLLFISINADLLVDSDVTGWFVYTACKLQTVNAKQSNQTVDIKSCVELCESELSDSCSSVTWSKLSQKCYISETDERRKLIHGRLAFAENKARLEDLQKAWWTHGQNGKTDSVCARGSIVFCKEIEFNSAGWSWMNWNGTVNKSVDPSTMQWATGMPGNTANCGTFDPSLELEPKLYDESCDASPLRIGVCEIEIDCPATTTTSASSSSTTGDSTTTSHDQGNCKNLSAGGVWIESAAGDRCLFAVSERKDWASALTACSKSYSYQSCSGPIRGRLAFVEDTARLDDMIALIKKIQIQSTYIFFWIGLQQTDPTDEPAGGWSWVNADGTVNKTAPLSTTPWNNKTEPNDMYEAEDCGSYYKFYGIIDFVCQFNTHYVCEIELIKCD